MTVLRQGDSGDAITALQQRLAELGYTIEDQQGEFGDSTAAAVQQFQQTQGLDADGLVGPRTAGALGLGEEDEDADSGEEEESDDVSGGMDGETAIAPFTVDAVFAIFPGAKRGNIETHLPPVLKAMVNQGLTDRRLILAALATIRAETGGFTPLSEFVSKYNTSPGGQPFDLYNNRKSLGNGPEDGAAFKGRGFIQLTGRNNYTSIGEIIGQPLADNPDLANDPDIAADILAVFIKRVAGRMLSALAQDDLRTARKLVNGGSYGLDEFSKTYDAGRPLLEA